MQLQATKPSIRINACSRCDGNEVNVWCRISIVYSRTTPTAHAHACPHTHTHTPLYLHKLLCFLHVCVNQRMSPTDAECVLTVTNIISVFYCLAARQGPLKCPLHRALLKCQGSRGCSSAAKIIHPEGDSERSKRKALIIIMIKKKIKSFGSWEHVCSGTLIPEKCVYKKKCSSLLFV